MGGTLAPPPLDKLLERFERLVGLALGHPADEHSRGEAPHRAARGLELVLVLEVRPAVAVRLEAIGDARVGAGRPLALPRAEVRGVALRQRPAHGERGPPQREPLLDMEALADLAVVDVAEPAVDGDPLV